MRAFRTMAFRAKWVPVHAKKTRQIKNLVCRFVAVNLKMLDRQRPVMRRHLLVMLL
jgi:hypothetical protein